MANWENISFTIETHSSSSLSLDLSQHDGKFKSKYKWNWRIKQLALPKSIVKKLAPQKAKVIGKIDPECEWRTNQLSNPKLQRLILNRKQVYNKNLLKNYNKHITNTINSIYYYYFKKLRDIAIKKKKRKAQMKRKKSKIKPLTAAEIEKKTLEYFNQLSQPKPEIVPAKIAKLWKDLDELMPGILRLSQPHQYVELPPKFVGVSPNALKYKITEHTDRLAEVPEHRRYIPPPPTPPPKKRIKIKDMKIILSERLERIAQPKPKWMKKDEDLKEDPWSIPPNALKYKATPRILELAKPIERD